MKLRGTDYSLASFLSYYTLVMANLISTSKPEKNMKIVPQTQQKSRLQEFKQMSVETFALLKQKLNESRRPNTERPRMGNYSFLITSKFHLRWLIFHEKISGSIGIEHSELQSCDCYGEAFLSVQQYKNRRVLTGLFIPESVLLVYHFICWVTILFHLRQLTCDHFSSCICKAKIQ